MLSIDTANVSYAHSLMLGHDTQFMTHDQACEADAVYLCCVVGKIVACTACTTYTPLCKQLAYSPRLDAVQG